MFTWLHMPHLPRVPDHFVQQALDIAHGVDPSVGFPKEKNLVGTSYNEDYKNRKLLLDGKLYNSRHGERYPLSAEWEQWVRDNIAANFVETGVSLSVGVDTHIHGPHCDTPVKWKLYYLLERGGDDAWTMFYKQKNKPIIQYGELGKPVHATDFNDVEELERVQWPMHQWVILDPNVMHAVTGITGARIMFAVSIEVDSVSFTIVPKV